MLGGDRANLFPLEHVMKHLAMLMPLILTACAAETGGVPANSTAFDGHYVGTGRRVSDLCSGSREPFPITLVVRDGRASIDLRTGSRVVGTIAADGTIHGVTLMSRGIASPGISSGSGHVRDEVFTLNLEASPQFGGNYCAFRYEGRLRR